MTVKSADKKPEKYVGPDGKPKIRMVSVDKEVVKSEGGMKRIATTLSNKADRMAAGGKKGLETFKKKTKESVEEAMQHGDAKAAAHNFAKSHKNLAVTSVGNNHFVHHKAAKRDELEAAETFKFHHADGKIHVTHDSKDEHGGGFKGVRSRKAGSVNDAISHASKLFKMDEAYDEPQGQAKRIMSPLQKARMDKEKADRDRDGKLKSESKSFKDFREANTPVGQRDKMKIIDRKPHPDGGHIVTMQTKAGKTIKRHLKNGKVKDMTEATDDDYHKTLGPTKNSDEGIAALKKKHGMSHTKAVATMKRLMGEAIDMSKVGTKATIMHPVTRVSKKVDKKDVKKHVDAGWMHMGPKRNRVTKGPFKTKEGYASDAQRKAVWASKNEKGKKESVDEVLDTPKAMQSYKDKAKYSRDRASGSAAAKILSKGTLGSHKPELDTMRKRHKGMDMADRNAKKKTFDALRGKK